LCVGVDSTLKKSSSDYWKQGPIVVHCSAGIGRSGSFIAIHSCLSLLAENKDYDIDHTVLKMREGRIGMVQTEKQYEFIHHAIAEHLLDERYEKTFSTSLSESSPFYSSNNPTHSSSVSAPVMSQA